MYSEFKQEQALFLQLYAAAITGVAARTYENGDAQTPAEVAGIAKLITLEAMAVFHNAPYLPSGRK